MPRLPADIRISLKRRGGKTHRIELIRQPLRDRFWVRRDGKRSLKLPQATATQIADKIRRWLAGSFEWTDPLPGTWEISLAPPDSPSDD
jgi:hypothetical protein